MKKIQLTTMTLLATTLLAGNALALTPFESGSTCGTANFNAATCLGEYIAPTANSVIVLPADGILDYTTFTVPSGRRLTFTKNAANTPIIIRTSGNVIISGVIDVSAQTGGTDSGTIGNGNLGDDGQQGISGPGGFDGGRGGLSPLFGGAQYISGGSGKGPGGGGTQLRFTGTTCSAESFNGQVTAGAGGGFGAAGAGVGSYCFNSAWQQALGGLAYGQSSLLPLIGGSGGGGGYSGPSFNGGGGGAGGGAILIASSGTILMGNGAFNEARIFANGTAGGSSGGSGAGAGGGGGSGGAIRLVAEKLDMNANSVVYAIGGNGGSGAENGGIGGIGRIRFEANTITGWTTGYSSPSYSYGLPGHVFVPNNPTLRIVSVTPTAGPDNAVVKTVPAVLTGNADITFQTGTTTATINLEATNIPEGSTAFVHVIPSSGASRSVVQSVAFGVPVGGVLTPASPVTVTLSPGNNILQATVTYTVSETVAVAMNLPKFNGEYVAKIKVEGGMKGESKVTYITASGKEYPAVKAKA